MGTLLNNIVAYYQLENNSGSDISGNGNTLGTIVNSTFSLANGKIGFGVGLVGNGYLLCSPSSLLTGAQPRSISCWFKTTSVPPSGVRQILQTSNNITPGTPTTLAFILLSTGILSVGTYGGNVSSGIVVTDGLWHHAVVTFDTSNIRLYLDNVLVNTGVINVSFSNSNIIIGAQTTTTNLFVGEIDEVGIWNMVLTASEVSLLWNNGNGITYPFSPPITGNPSFLLNII
jgi:hypothetical protein